MGTVTIIGLILAGGVACLYIAAGLQPSRRLFYEITEWRECLLWREAIREFDKAEYRNELSGSLTSVLTLETGGLKFEFLYTMVTKERGRLMAYESTNQVSLNHQNRFYYNRLVQLAREKLDAAGRL